MGCVYFFRHNDTDYVKIGMTKSDNPKKRFEAFKTYAPSGGEILGYINCKNYRQIEKELHRQYNAYRVNGEWFNITDSEVENSIDSYKTDLYIHEVVNNKKEVIFTGFGAKSCHNYIKNWYKEANYFYDRFWNLCTYRTRIGELIIKRTDRWK